MLALLLAFVLPARAALPDCVEEKPAFYAAQVSDPARNLAIIAEPKRMKDACADGVFVTNGTFFAAEGALGDVIVDGQAVRSPSGSARRFKSGPRMIDLGKRWGIGVLKGSQVLGLASGDDALRTMGVYLGGGGILLSDGEDATFLNKPAKGKWGASFPGQILDDGRGRAALGIKMSEGRQVLLAVFTKSSARATVKILAQIMKDLGASEAVFYDGGGAAGLAAGGACLLLPTNPGEDLNPTHIALRACR